MSRALGGSNTNPTPKGKCDEVEVQYPLTLARALIEASKTSAEHVCHVVKIRFLLISGMFSVRDQEKSLWLLKEGRKARVCLPIGLYIVVLKVGIKSKQGLAETRLLELAEKSGNFEAVVVKCGYVLQKDNVVPELLVGFSKQAIRVDELAAAMVELAVMGSGSNTIRNAELRSLGKRLLKEQVEKAK